MDQFYLLTFNNTHEAIHAEKVLNEFKLEPVIMPTPTYITKSCGLSIKLVENNFSKAAELLKDNKFKIKSSFSFKDNRFVQIEINS